MVSEPSSGTAACLADVLITGELARRPARAPDFAAENRALRALALEMANQPHRVLQKLAELVVELLHADSAGINILEPGGEHGVFRWHAVVGPFAVHLGGTLPRDHSPCGVVVARGAVQLFDGVERCFPGLSGVAPQLHESLLAPWNADSEAVGTVWAIAHTLERHFDAEDARVLESLATHAASAYRIGAALADAHDNRRALEERVEERTRLLTEANARLQLEVEGRRAADRMVEMIERQVRQMVRLVNDLMDVSRITRGKIGLSKTPVALADILGSAIETSQPAIDNAHHVFTVSLPAEPLMLHADKVRLTQVFANLLNNAAKYTDRGGRIWLDAQRDGDMAVVRVRDNGTGIDAAALPHVFEMFAQAHAPSDRHQGGLGIGLTMVRNLVHLHGGTVEARSAGSGMGSEFEVRLPLRAQGAAAAGPGEAAPPAAMLAGRRVLVVDDNRDAADSLCLLLKTAGATVEVRYDGLAALAAVQESGPGGFDAMVLDIGMPGMDGHTVAHRVRGDGRFAGMKIVALTGWGQQVDRARSHTNGIDHHLTKPVDWKVLVNLLAAG